MGFSVFEEQQDFVGCASQDILLHHLYSMPPLKLASQDACSAHSWGDNSERLKCKHSSSLQGVNQTKNSGGCAIMSLTPEHKPH